MGIVPGAYDVHGWHPFQSGWQGENWCGLCDCTDAEHISAEEYELRKSEFELSAQDYRRVSDKELVYS